MSRSPVAGVSYATKSKVVLRAQALCQYWYDETGRCGTPLWEVTKGGRLRLSNLSDVAHIYSPMSKGPRYMKVDAGPDDLNREWNLLLLCLPHHKKIDDDWENYPPELLLEWRDRQTYIPGLIYLSDEVLRRLLQEVNVLQ